MRNLYELKKLNYAVENLVIGMELKNIISSAEMSDAFEIIRAADHVIGARIKDKDVLKEPAYEALQVLEKELLEKLQ